MREFNVSATMASGGRFRHMMDDLKPFGEFHRTEFTVVALETVGDRCGVGLLTREVLKRYDFVRVG